MIDITDKRAAENPSQAFVGIDYHAAHGREVDHEAVVDAAEPRAVVTAAPDSDVQATFAAKVDCSNDVRDIDAKGK